MAGSRNDTERNHSSPYVVEPISNHTHSFILLHGLGSNGKEFGQVLLETGICSNGQNLREIFRGARFIFPTAKRRRSSAFSRAKLTQWYDIASLDDPSVRQHTQLKGLAESVPEILMLINQESQKVPYRNVILGGLSQGCSMALSCLLAIDFPIGGFIGMSGWLPFSDEIEHAIKGEDEVDDDENHFGPDSDDSSTSSKQDQTKLDPIVKALKHYRNLLCLEELDNPTTQTSSISTPVFLGHGTDDEKVKICFGENARHVLVLIGYKVLWKSYKDQGHWYKIPDEIDDLVGFIRDKVDRKSVHI
ncbi:Alpha/Beta hydrolase protein [Xylogone sp. PMI_703]|nr:Alpha/Beta hydrolase protein [Xylogone sp. PMI_703]